VSARVPQPVGLDSVERMELPRRLVPATREGARALGEWYWEELERSSRGLIRARAENGGLRVVLGRAVTLLRFGPPDLAVEGEDVECRYPIVGGTLVSHPGGSLTIAQRDGAVTQLEVTVTEYRPSLAERGSRLHRGVLYTALQAPLHRSVSRRFLTRTARREQ
jgi:hypothetical protein